MKIKATVAAALPPAKILAAMTREANKMAGLMGTDDVVVVVMRKEATAFAKKHKLPLPKWKN